MVTRDASVAERLRALRSYGWEDERRVSTAAGLDSRLDELQAAILVVMLAHLEQGNRERAGIADRYRRVLNEAAEAGALGLPAVDPGAVHHQFAIEVDERDRFRAWVGERGIGTGVHYPVGLHRQPAFAGGAAPDDLPVTELLARRFVSLPIQPEVVGDRAGWIAETVGEGVTEWTCVIFGVGSSLVVDLEEGLRRGKVSVAAAVADVPGEVHLIDRSALIDRDGVTPEIAALPLLVPLFSPQNRHLAVEDATRLGFTTAFRFTDPTVDVPRSLSAEPGLWVNTARPSAAQRGSGASC